MRALAHHGHYQEGGQMHFQMQSPIIYTTNINHTFHHHNLKKFPIIDIGDHHMLEFITFLAKNIFLFNRDLQIFSKTRTKALTLFIQQIYV